MQVPIICFRRCWQVLVANSMALLECGINDLAPSAEIQENPLIEKRPSGELTGVFRGEAMQLVDNLLQQEESNKEKLALRNSFLPVGKLRFRCCGSPHSLGKPRFPLLCGLSSH